DVLAGIAISLLFVPEEATLDWSVLLALIIATIGLYGGGVVFNDVFDADLDARERPERPIPSGKVSAGGATKLAMALFFADVLAGIAISLLFVPEEATLDWSVLLALIIATIGLYGGGVVFNDVFDADLDARERPERPIPSGKVSVGGATKLAMALFFAGVVA